MSRLEQRGVPPGAAAAKTTSRRPHWRSLRLLLIALGLSGITAGARAQSAEPSPAAQSVEEQAVLRLGEGNYAAAAQHVRRGMQANPDDGLLNLAAGSIALCTGDFATAKSAFEHALRSDAEDSLAQYGLGLAQLGQGNRAAALSSFDRSEKAGGDRAYLLVARRYVQWLAGAQIAVKGVGSTEQTAPAYHSLQAMESAREGNWREAATSMAAALNALPGDPMVEPAGADMSFDPAHPIAAARDRLPPGSLSIAPDRGVVAGSVEISPEGSLDGVSYVSYELDGQPLGIVNVRPFVYTWDTRRFANGLHTLTVVLHDAAVNELGRTDRKIRVMNSGSDGPLEDAEKLRLKGLIWQSLALRPGRCSGSYYLGLACRALGDSAAARAWFGRCLAIEPDYKDARRQWQACGGLGSDGNPAVWGGLTTEKVVALTFDDGPKPGVTEPLLDVLKQERVPATFFVIGRHVTEYPELTKQIADSGMEIANHSYTHRNLTRLSDIDISREVLQTQAAVQAATGKVPRFLRPPGGNWNPRVADATRSWGLTPCMWTVDVYGSEVIGAQQVADAVLKQVRPGSIILMHNGKVSTLQALPTIIRALRSRGYAFATVDTLERRLGTARTAARAGEVRQRAE